MNAAIEQSQENFRNDESVIFDDIEQEILQLGDSDEFVITDEYSRPSTAENKFRSIPLELIQRGLSNMGKSPDGLRQNAGLTDISSLQHYKYIQTLCLPGNNLTDISCLGAMRYLSRLDLHDNKLTKVLEFSPAPYNLQEIDFSRNLINVIGDLSEHRFLKAICLDRKRNNKLTSLRGIETLTDLQELRASDNYISSLGSLTASHKYLQILDLDNNQIEVPEEVTVHLKSTLPMLTKIFLRQNPVSGEDLKWRLLTAFHFQDIEVLDGIPLSVEEKVAAVNIHDPPPSVVAALRHAHHIKRQTRLYAKIKAEDLMRATWLRPIVLCGPSGVGKRTLTNRLLKDYPHIFGVSVSHTTRKPRLGEENGVHYHFVSREEMEDMEEQGKFVEVISLFGSMYGTSMESIDKVTEEGKGVLALKRSHLKPYYIYVTVPSLQVLKRRIANRLNPLKLQNTGSEPDSAMELDSPETNDEVSPVTPQSEGSSIQMYHQSRLDLTTNSRPASGFPDRIYPIASPACSPSDISQAETLESQAAVQDLQGAIQGAQMVTDLDTESYETARKLMLRKQAVEERVVSPRTAKHDLLEQDIYRWSKQLPSQDIFSLKIINDDPDRAYNELREFCVGTYLNCFSQGDNLFE